MYVCALCGEKKHIPVNSEICLDCSKIGPKYSPHNQYPACDHNCKWDYHTRGGFDEYGNEYTIDVSTCNVCNEVMEEERTS